MLELDGAEQRPRAERRRRSEKHAPEAVAAAAHAHDRSGERVRVVDVGGARRGEIAVLGEVRALRELHAARELGDEEVEVGVAVSVPVRRHVHRHPCHRRREVGAVIEIEAAQIVLVGLALAAVLADDDAGDRFEDVAGPHDRARVELSRGDGALARGLGDADEILLGRRRVSEVGKGRLAGDRDVRAQHEVHDRVDRQRVCADRNRAPDRREVDQRERELGAARGDGVEPVLAALVAVSVLRRCRSGAQLDQNTWERRAGFVAERAAQSSLLRRGERRRAEQERRHTNGGQDTDAESGRQGHRPLYGRRVRFGCVESESRGGLGPAIAARRWAEDRRFRVE